jgi:hypothetical protein
MHVLDFFAYLALPPDSVPRGLFKVEWVPRTTMSDVCIIKKMLFADLDAGSYHIESQMKSEETEILVPSADLYHLLSETRR